jgi:hypothetical protein
MNRWRAQSDPPSGRSAMNVPNAQHVLLEALNWPERCQDVRARPEDSVGACLRYMCPRVQRSTMRHEVRRSPRMRRHPSAAKCSAISAVTVQTPGRGSSAMRPAAAHIVLRRQELCLGLKRRRRHLCLGGADPRHRPRPPVDHRLAVLLTHELMPALDRHYITDDSIARSNGRLAHTGRN